MYFRLHVPLSYVKGDKGEKKQIFTFFFMLKEIEKSISFIDHIKYTKSFVSSFLYKHANLLSMSENVQLFMSLV